MQKSQKTTGKEVGVVKCTAENILGSLDPRERQAGELIFPALCYLRCQRRGQWRKEDKLGESL